MADDKLIAVPESLLTDIGDAIRTKRDITTPIPVPDMAMQIGLIEGGGSPKTLLAMNDAFELTQSSLSISTFGDFYIDMLYFLSNSRTNAMPKRTSYSLSFTLISIIFPPKQKWETFTASHYSIFPSVATMIRLLRLYPGIHIQQPPAVQQ